LPILLQSVYNNFMAADPARAAEFFRALGLDTPASPFAAGEAPKPKKAPQPARGVTHGNAPGLPIDSGAKEMSDMLLGKVEVSGGKPPIPTVEPPRPQQPVIEIARTPEEIEQALTEHDPVVTAQVQTELEGLAQTIPIAPNQKKTFIPQTTLGELQALARTPAGQEVVRSAGQQSSPLTQRRRMAEAGKAPKIVPTTPPGEPSGSLDKLGVAPRGLDHLKVSPARAAEITKRVREAVPDAQRIARDSVDTVEDAESPK
jgi:hypothetical protein